MRSMAEVLEDGVLRPGVVRAAYHLDESQSVAVTSMVSDAKTSDISSCEEGSRLVAAGGDS